MYVAPPHAISVEIHSDEINVCLNLRGKTFKKSLIFLMNSEYFIQRRIQQFKKGGGGGPFDENQYVQNSSFVNKQGLFERFPCVYNCI